MPSGGGSDSKDVAQGPRPHTAIRRHLLQATVCASLFALCVCFCVAASTAPAATPSASVKAESAASHARRQAPRKRRRTPCARHASFHSSSGAKGGSHGHKCARRRAKPHHSVPAPVPVDGVCPNATLRPNAKDIAQIRTATLCLVNRERLSHGERPLQPNGKLTRAAQSHSQDMASGDYFSHDGRGGSTPLSRMRAAGYIFSSHLGYAIGENIAWGTLRLATPGAIVRGWMASPGHRANILDATFRDTGMGVYPRPLALLARGQAGATYTQDFGRLIFH